MQGAGIVNDAFNSVLSGDSGTGRKEVFRIRSEDVERCTLYLGRNRV